MLTPSRHSRAVIKRQSYSVQGLPFLRPVRLQGAAAGRRKISTRVADNSQLPRISNPFAQSQQSTRNATLNSGHIEATAAAQFLGNAFGAVLVAYAAQPFLLSKLSELLDSEGSSSGSFETSFFGLVGIIYGLMAGNTFLYQYERQVNIVQELYGEAFALELLLQQTFLAIPDQKARREMAACVREYLDEEIYQPNDMTSPFDPDSSFSKLVKVVCQEQQNGVDVTGIVSATQKLADAQSRRSAVAAQVLPGMHWVFLNALLAIFTICFLVFDVDTDAGSVALAAERRIGFTALVGVLVLTQQVLFDLNDPIKGLYSFRNNLDARMTYVIRLLSQLEAGENGFVPEELTRLNQLGLIGAMTTSDSAPSVGTPVRLGHNRRLNENSYPGGPLNMFDAAWDNSEQQTGAQNGNANGNGRETQSAMNGRRASDLLD